MKRLNKKIFYNRCKEKHNDKYTYFDDFTTTREKIKINCPKHGIFFQQAKRHLNGQGCPICGKEYAQTYRKGDYTSFIKESQKRFNDTYDFPNIETLYENSHSTITIQCKMCGKTFEKRANDHLTSPCGGCNCRNEKKSSLEKDVEKLLTEENIQFKEEKSFPWLKLKRLDFYLPQYNIAIECQGMQHFKPIKRFGGKEGLEKQIQRDLIKQTECNKHNIPILYYTPYKINSINFNLIHDIETLKQEILKYGSKENNKQYK